MWIKKSLLLSIFALFAVLFGSCIITSRNVSAVADISVTVSSGVYLSDVFSNCSTPQCLNSYKYLIVSGPSDFGSSSFLLRVPRTPSLSTYSDFYIGGWNRYDSSNFTSIFTLPFSSEQSNSFLVWGSNYTFSSSVTLTLSESYQSCPICPEIPDNPYDDKLDSIRNAIILVPAVCLLLYFFYIIFGIIIPTTGGKK